MNRNSCPDLFDEREPFDEFIGFDRSQLRLHELRHEGAIVYSMDVKRGGYLVRGRRPVPQKSATSPTTEAHA